MERLHQLLADVSLPPLHRIRQHIATSPIPDVAATLRYHLDSSSLHERITPGMRVAITAGSRGISNIVLLLHTCVAWLREHGAEPFIIPAMGSHGGATAYGQQQLLATLGITAASMQCPLLATMDVVQLGTLPDGTSVVIDRYAAEADAILVINRIKPHTSFKAPIESGLAKMCAVGLGKQHGAHTVHSRGVFGLKHLLVPMARLVVERGNVVAGVAILEDAHKQTTEIAVVPPAAIGGERESALLERSRHLMAKLPCDALDVLVVDEIGKHISGTGMDTNVIGRLRIAGEMEPTTPHIAIIVALDLGAESHGNAVGIGLADIITAQIARKVDHVSTYMNSLTAGIIGMQRGALPITLLTPRDAIAAALHVCGQPNPHAIRLMRIHNTLALDELLISPALLPLVETSPHLEYIGTAAWDGV